MIISEIFDTIIIPSWQKNGRFELASFNSNGYEYVIQIENKPLHFVELKNKKTAEISFYRNLDDSEAAHSTTHEIKNPFYVYGGVANALLEKFMSFEAFYFNAEIRHSDNKEQFETKKEIYSFLGNRMAKRTGTKFYEKNGTDQYEVIVSKIPLANSRGFIVEAEAALDWFRSQNFEPSIIK